MKRLIPILLLLLSTSSCNKKEVESFDFTLRWGIQGNFMYDAKNEIAYKEYLSKEKEKYSNKISLSEEIKKAIISQLNDINIYSYPAVLDPYYKGSNIKKAQSPQYKIVLDLNDKVIETIDEMPSIDNKDFRKMCTKKTIRFFDCIKEITSYIVNTDIWENIPDDGMYFL